MCGITSQQRSDPGSPETHPRPPRLAQLHCMLRTTPWWPWKLSRQWDLDSGVRSAEASHQDSPGSGDIHSQSRSIQQQAWNRDVANPIKISSIMWHTLLGQSKGFGSVGPNQVGLCGVSHFRFKSLLNPLLRLVVNNIFVSVFRDDRQPSSPAGPEASVPLFVESGSVHERQKSHRPSVFWLAQRKAEWQTSFQSAWPMQGNGAIWSEKGFRLLLCEREGGWRKRADLNPPTMHSHLVISWIRNSLAGVQTPARPAHLRSPASPMGSLGPQAKSNAAEMTALGCSAACSFGLNLRMCLLMS